MIYLVCADYDESTNPIKAFTSRGEAVKWVLDAQNLVDEMSRWRNGDWVGTTMDDNAMAGTSYWYKEIKLDNG